MKGTEETEGILDFSFVNFLTGYKGCCGGFLTARSGDEVVGGVAAGEVLKAADRKR